MQKTNEKEWTPAYGINFTYPHKYIISLQNLFVFILALDEEKFAFYFASTFLKDFDPEDITDEVAKNMRDFGRRTYKDIIKIAKPMIANIQQLPSFEISLDFKNEESDTESGKEKQEKSKPGKFDDVDFGEFNLELG